MTFLTDRLQKWSCTTHARIVCFLLIILKKKIRISQLSRHLRTIDAILYLQAEGRKCWTCTYIGYSFFHLWVIERLFSFHSIDLMLTVKKLWHNQRSQSALLFELFKLLIFQIFFKKKNLIEEIAIFKKNLFSSNIFSSFENLEC